MPEGDDKIIELPAKPTENYSYLNKMKLLINVHEPQHYNYDSKYCNRFRKEKYFMHNLPNFIVKGCFKFPLWILAQVTNMQERHNISAS